MAEEEEEAVTAAEAEADKEEETSAGVPNRRQIQQSGLLRK